MHRHPTIHPYSGNPHQTIPTTYIPTSKTTRLPSSNTHSPTNPTYTHARSQVFFSSCNSVKFHAELLNYIDIEAADIHGKQKQQKRTTTFFNFCKADKGILLCTDVAARGLDIPKVSITQHPTPTMHVVPKF